MGTAALGPDGPGGLPCGMCKKAHRDAAEERGGGEHNQADNWLSLPPTPVNTLYFKTKWIK